MAPVALRGSTWSTTSSVPSGSTPSDAAASIVTPPTVTVSANGAGAVWASGVSVDCFSGAAKFPEGPSVVSPVCSVACSCSGSALAAGGSVTVSVSAASLACGAAGAAGSSAWAGASSVVSASTFCVPVDAGSSAVVSTTGSSVLA